MSWLSEWLHPEKGYERGQEELDKYYNQGQGYLNPYNQNGMGQYGNLQDYIKNLMDPQALQDKWAKGYKESEAAKNLEGMATEHGLDAASALGLNGSSPALQAIQAGTSGIAAQDRQNYLNDLMTKYMQGAGIAGGLYNTGANAAGQMSNNAMNMGQNSAQMAYGQQNARGNLFGNILGAGLGLFGGPLASGFSQSMGWSPQGSYNPRSWNIGR